MPIEQAVFHSAQWVVFWTAPGDAPSLAVPTASFTVTLELPTTVVDFDASGSTDTTGTIVEYTWDFGDGSATVNTFDSPLITHTYAAAGSYTASLTVTDDAGVTASISHPVLIALNKPPVAKFVLTKTNFTASVDGSTSTDTDGKVIGYAWNFGDGATASGVTSSHVYAKGGTYNITLTVTDDKGATGSTTQSVTFASVPVAGFTTSTNALTVSVDASSTTDLNPISSYAWDWGDGITTAASASKTATHTYSAAGTYPITLTVKDVLSQIDTQTNSVTVSVVTPTNHPPTAAITTTTSSRTVTASGAGSSDPDAGDSIVSYAWTWGDGGTATGVAPAAHTYATNGTYTIGLTVTDTHSATGTASKSVTVGSVTNNPPVAAYTTTISALSVVFNGSSSTDDVGISSYDWDFGDATTHGTGVAPTHVYANSGTYNAKLTVTDTGGLTNAVTHAVTVTAVVPNQPPKAAFSSTVTNLTVSFNGGASTDDVSIASYDWDFGDGSPRGAGVNTSHVYASANTWTVTLTVKDGAGLTGAVSHSVTTSAVPTGGSVPTWDHIVIVMEENHSYAEIVSTGYFATLVAGGLNFTQSFGVTHPSEPNYYALFSGSTQGITDDAVHWYTSANLYSQMAGKGLSFKAYSELLPSIGSTAVSAGTNGYVRKHAPWVSWQTDATSNPGGNVPGSVHHPFSEWQTTTTFYASLPKVTFVIPTLADDMHDGTVSGAASWVQTHLSGYATWAKTNNSLLIVTTDEDDLNTTNANHIFTVAYGANVVPGSNYGTKINHYDILGLIQDSLKLPRLANSVGKPSITSPWSTVAPTTNWQLAWSDEFLGTAVDTTVWNVDNNTTFGSGNSELEVQLASNATVANSQLAVTARTLTSPILGMNYSSAHLSSSGKQTFTIGPNNPLKIEVYAKLPDVTHLLPAPIWLRPSDGQYGEVDPIEASGTTDTDNAGNTRISQTVHTHTYTPDIFTGIAYNLTDTGGVTNWHTYGAEIYSDRTLFFVDGKQTGRVDATSIQNGTTSTPLGTTYNDVFGTNRSWFMHITLGVGGNYPGTPTAATIFPAVMSIDWVRVYNTTGPVNAVVGDAGGNGITQSGTNYTTLSGSTFSAKVNTATSVALPAGNYTFSNFADGTGASGFWYGANITATNLLGAGSKYSNISMVANTSTRASSVPAQSTGASNQLQYIAMNTANSTVDGVKIQGTNQGHLYNGLRFESVASPTLSNSTIAGIPGDAGSPPGETFAVNFQRATGTVTVTNVTVDGQGLTAAAIGSNNSGATYIISNYLATNCPYSAGWASWEHTGVMSFGAPNSPTKRFVMRKCARAFNAERLAGTVNFYDPLWDDPMSGHFDVNPTYETGWIGGTLNFYFSTQADWSAFIANRTNKKITAVSNTTSVALGLSKANVIKVYIAGALQTQSNYVVWTGI